MRVSVEDVKVQCPKHGEVSYAADNDLDGEVTLYCPKCEQEGRDSEVSPTAEKDLWKDEATITLYRTLRSIGEPIQRYEDAEGKTFIKTGNFYREIEIDADGHLETMLGRCFLVENVRIEDKKYPPPKTFA